MGSTTESVLQPEWADESHLYALSDRSGWWNLYRLSVDTPDGSSGELELLGAVAADIGGPLWILGTPWYRVLGDGRVLAVRTLGIDQLGWLDPNVATDSWHDLELGDLTSIQLGGTHGSKVGITADGARTPRGVRVPRSVQHRPRRYRPSQVRRPARARVWSTYGCPVDELPDGAYLPSAEAMTFTDQANPDGRAVHAIVYPPASPDFIGPPDELPPYVTFVHGGPTSHEQPHLAMDIAYLTSRGVGVIDVNYGGSTGYGRDYRRRLNGQGVLSTSRTP